MAFELSCCDFTFRRLSHELALRVIADLGIPAVDLSVFAHNPWFSTSEVLADPARRAAEAKRQVQAAGVKVADVFALLTADFETLAVNHPDGEVRAESRRWFERILEFAARVGAPGVTVIPGIPWPGESEQASRARSAEELQWRAERAAREGLQLSIEPHYQSIAATPDTALELLRQAPDLTLTLDYAHVVYQGIPEQEVDVLIPRTRHLHGRQAARGMMQARASEGTIDFPRLLRAFQQAGYHGHFALEYEWDEWMDCTNVDCISESALLRDIFLQTLGGATSTG